MVTDSAKGKLTSREAAERLGVDHSTLTRWALHGCDGVRLRGTKVGWRWVFAEEDLAAFLDACNQRTDGEARR
jgi:excisionase family DNA binding protein